MPTNDKISKLKELINNSLRILITSHISPDPDGVSSVALLNAALRQQHPDKQIAAVLEEEPADLGFIEGYQDITFEPVLESLQKFQPELFILLDGNNFERCSRHDGIAIRDFVRSQGIRVAIIDHHELAGSDQAEVFINRDSAAVAQDIYEILFDQLGFARPQGAEQTAMTGFYADTGGFVYVKAGMQDKIFGFAEKLTARGADIEAVKYSLESYTEDDMKVLSELGANVGHGGDYTYSFLSDKFIGQWLEQNHTILQLQRAINAFVNNYIRNIEGRHWGFIVYKNVLQGDDYYSASFRSQAGHPDVSRYATALGGGGHKPAAGAKFEAASLEDALEEVKRVINNGN